MEQDTHDLTYSLDALWQCLSQDKRPLGLLLGAGCPVSIRVDKGDGTTAALIPDIAGLTDRIASEIKSSANKDRFDALVQGLTEDLEHAPNIEEMLTRLRTLSTIAGAHEVRNLSLASIETLERAITDAINGVVQVDIPAEITPYDHLALWARSASRTFPVKIFTTNYDLLLEAAFERNNAPFFDGFVGVTEPFLDGAAMELDDLPPRWARIWKLHGSVNWTLLATGRVVRRSPVDDEERRLIHPSHLKYDESRRMPYLLMQDQLRDFLREPSATLSIVGYSFGDDHINELLVQGLRSNPSAAAFGIQHSDLDKYPIGCELAIHQPSLSLIARDGAVLAGRKAKWRSDPDDEPTACPLGDFAKFGEYLRRLVGRTTVASGEGDVAH